MGNNNNDLPRSHSYLANIVKYVPSTFELLRLVPGPANSRGGRKRGCQHNDGSRLEALPGLPECQFRPCGGMFGHALPFVAISF